LCKHLFQDKDKHRGLVPDDEYFLDLYCEAFPDGVPPYIRDWGGHFTPKPGDNGIMFEPDEILNMTPKMLEYQKKIYPDKSPEPAKKSA
jgi:hypothetical protein